MKKKLVLAAALFLGVALYNASASVINISLNEAANSATVSWPEQDFFYTLNGITLTPTVGGGATLAFPLPTVEVAPEFIVQLQFGKGDVIIKDVNGKVSDVLRFDTIPIDPNLNPFNYPNTTLFMYSADIGGGSLADVGLPTSTPANWPTITIQENAAGVATYTVNTGGIGYINQLGLVEPGATVLYTINSPEVPEPTTMIAGALLLLPFGASTLRLLRKR